MHGMHMTPRMYTLIYNWSHTHNIDDLLLLVLMLLLWLGCDSICRVDSVERYPYMGIPPIHWHVFYSSLFYVWMQIVHNNTHNAALISGLSHLRLFCLSLYIHQHNHCVLKSYFKSWRLLLNDCRTKWLFHFKINGICYVAPNSYSATHQICAWIVWTHRH